MVCKSVWCVAVYWYVIKVGTYNACVMEWSGIGVSVYRSVEWSSFSSNSNSSMELKLHHPLFPPYICPHTLTGKPLLPGPRPRPHPDHLCGAILSLRGVTGAEDQV